MYDLCIIQAVGSVVMEAHLNIQKGFGDLKNMFFFYLSFTALDTFPDNPYIPL